MQMMKTRTIILADVLEGGVEILRSVFRIRTVRLHGRGLLPPWRTCRVCGASSGPSKAKTNGLHWLESIGLGRKDSWVKFCQTLAETQRVVQGWPAHKVMVRTSKKDWCKRPNDRGVNEGIRSDQLYAATLVVGPMEDG